MARLQWREGGTDDSSLQVVRASTTAAATLAPASATLAEWVRRAIRRDPADTLAPPTLSPDAAKIIANAFLATAGRACAGRGSHRGARVLSPPVRETRLLTPHDRTLGRPLPSFSSPSSRRWG